MTPMTTPFTGQPAVAYGYRAWRHERQRRGENSFDIAQWWGEGSTPCSLLTARGSFEVRSRLEIEAWSSIVENTATARAHFDAFMRWEKQK